VSMRSHPSSMAARICSAESASTDPANGSSREPFSPLGAGSVNDTTKRRTSSCNSGDSLSKRVVISARLSIWDIPLFRILPFFVHPHTPQAPVGPHAIPHCHPANMREPITTVAPEILNGIPCFPGTRVPFNNLNLSTISKVATLSTNSCASSPPSPVARK
jgi:hypothetical protein